MPITLRNAASVPNRYPFVKREVSSTARTNTGEAKPSLMSERRSKVQSTSAQINIAAKIRKSRSVNENKRGFPSCRFMSKPPSA